MKIGIIMGGISSEREISLNTGKSMAEALKDTDYEVIEIVINDKKDILNIPEIDFALIALHGKFGEDGTIQTYFDIMNIPYSGCNQLTSAICMDKNLTKKILKASDVPVANWITIKSTSLDELDKAYKLNFPVFVKPNGGGSSVGTFYVEDKSSLKSCVEESLKWDEEVMIEEFLNGEEITCPILDGETLPIVKIEPTSEFFDYKSKYNDGGANEYVSKYDDALQNKINEISKMCWRALNCSVYSRVDMIIQNGEPYVLEINTLPGMTKNSLFPKSAKAIGIDMKSLIIKVITLSLKRTQSLENKKGSSLQYKLNNKEKEINK